MVFSTLYGSPLGEMLLSSDGEALTGAWFLGQRYFPAAPMERRDDLPVFAAARAWLDAYFAGTKPDPRGLPLAPAGSDFQKLVWALLLDIPYGETTTYGALAVGGAVGHNPLSVIVPCHRVVGADGSLTGYAGGLAVKSWLLQHEGALS